MMCRKCGQEIDDEAVICVHCGVVQKVVVDNGGFGYGLLGCCIPIAGLALYFIWRDEKPNTAKSLKKGLIVYGCFLGLYILVYLSIITFFIISEI